jgi:hypothetical protein
MAPVLVELLLPVVHPPLAFVGYEPPAGGPAVDEGEVFEIQELFGFRPAETLKRSLPPVPRPRSSPETTMRVEPVRTVGTHWNPVPISVVLVMVPSGIENDSPPGMTPWKFGMPCT